MIENELETKFNLPTQHTSSQFTEQMPNTTFSLTHQAPQYSPSAPQTPIARSASSTPLSTFSQIAPSSIDDPKTTLWMGDLDPWMDENYVKQIWSTFGESVNVKMIRDKFTGMNAGYCFVDFTTHSSAMKALLGLNNTFIPNTNKLFKLNWASGGGINDKKDYQGPEFSIFVGDLGPEVTDQILLSTFQRYYPSCRVAKVVTDAVTGLSRGYGFVRFTDESEQQRSMIEMQGQYCGSRQMRISVATPKNRFSSLTQWNQMQTNPWICNNVQDPNNTTVFVGGLTNSYVSEEELASFFAPFGPITYVKIPPGKGCGFVSYVHRQSAEQAIAQLNGSLIGNNRIRLSWGRNNNSSSFNDLTTPMNSNLWNQMPHSASNNGYFNTPTTVTPLSMKSPENSGNISFSASNSPFSTPGSFNLLNQNEINTLSSIDPLSWKSEKQNTQVDAILRPSSSFANPPPSNLGGYRSLSSLSTPAFGSSFGLPCSAASSPELTRSISTPTPQLNSLSQSVDGFSLNRSVGFTSLSDIWN